MEVKSFDSPDELRPFTDKGKAEIVTLGEGAILRGYYEPGWRWSEHLKPIAKTDTCQIHHTGYVISGRMRVRTDDGQEGEVGPGDAFEVSPGHDAWVVGDEPVSLIDWTGAAKYAKG